MHRRVAVKGLGLAVTAFGVYKLTEQENPYILPVFALQESAATDVTKSLPKRSDLLKRLREEEFDVLVIGGGATGCGVALDATTRGLKTALVEREDFGSGTSSKSTKLIHGGVRYLQKAIMGLDREQYNLVREALDERASMLANAPHLTHNLPILLPVYKWWQVPYYWAGIKVYDLVAGRKLLKNSCYLSKKKVLEEFPTIKQENLCGGIVYYDGQQDDARMNLTVALTAVKQGAACSNHVNVKHLLFDQNNKVCGAHVEDVFSGETWNVRARCVVNATGPLTDSVRTMSNEQAKNMCQPSSGVHIVLPQYYCSRKMGLLDPSTSDGRVIFFLPWQGRTIAGTTDRKCPVTPSPVPTSEEVQFIVNEVKRYFGPDIQVREEDILSSWSGLRPLVSDPAAKDTQSLSRNHVVHVDENNLVTIAGGKWTTYRAMAEHAVNAVEKTLGSSGTCVTKTMQLEGAEGWNNNSYIGLVQKYRLSEDVAEHLSSAYGNKASEVAELACEGCHGNRVDPKFPFIEAQVKYAVQEEYACTVVDVLARRLRLAFLDNRTCAQVVPRMVEIMAPLLNWDANRKQKEIESAKQFLFTMGLDKN